MTGRTSSPGSAPTTPATPCELAQQAAKAGAHGLLVVTPYYSKPPAEGAGGALHRRSPTPPSLPVMLYDIPGRTGVRIGTPTLLRLAEHPRIVAVKDATGDLFAGSEVMARTGLAYYCGDDALNLAWLAHGAAGVVSVVGPRRRRRSTPRMVARGRRGRPARRPGPCTPRLMPGRPRRS